MSPRALWIALFGVVVVTILGSNLDVMEVDAAQYASMSRDMLASDDWLQLRFRGHDYLDKPPLLFWLSALSFKLCGVHNWSYKLPSILFAFLGIFTTYRFAALHYARETARLAALFFATSAAFLLMTNDVRCDTLLTGSVITAIWLGSAWMEQRRWWQLLGCALAIACGMLAKGPMGLMAPLLALGGELFFKKRWSLFRDLRLYVLPLLVAAALIPMCIGLYEQHGAHGLRFYFWEQSFGRLTGENRWKDDSSIFFFTHEVLWQTLPWTPLVLVGLWRSVVALVKRRALPEYASITGVLLVFVALSFSQFKLPHYLYVIIPLLAVQGALGWQAIEQRWLRNVQWSVLLVLYALLFILLGYCFREGSSKYVIVVALFILNSIFLTRSMPQTERLLTATSWGWIVISLSVNGHFYPYLLRYQANAEAGRWASDKGVAADHFYGLQVSGTALDFYAGHPVPWLSDAREAREVIAPGVVLYTDSLRYYELLDADLPPLSVKTLPNYPVQLLGLDFIFPSTRMSVVEDRYLLKY
jgi:4-amino-4-deoxy-L-arabinose transferase-like glycosyltransferase